MVTKAEVLDSLILETEVARIYSFIFGINGARALPLFPLVGEVLNAIDKQEESFVRMLEQSITVFCKVLDFNTSASVQQPLVESARRLEAIFKETCEIHDKFILITSEKHLERLFRRLDLGLSFSTSDTVLAKKPTKSPTAFITRQDPPGGRHDNDFEDICAVRILPTFAEISSQRSEYLPSVDSSQWR